MKLVPPPEDDYPAQLEKVIRALLDEGRAAGAAALKPIAYERQEIAKRPGLSRSIQGKVFQRDRFCCRYCGAKLIPAPLMELLGVIYPDEFPFHRNWRGGLTHPAILSRAPVVDHVDPGSAGGNWLAMDNLVTACWPCNGRKADFTLAQLGWNVTRIATDDWDGLTRFYLKLWREAGEPKPAYHGAWMKAFGCTLR